MAAAMMMERIGANSVMKMPEAMHLPTRSAHRYGDTLVA